MKIVLILIFLAIPAVCNATEPDASSLIWPGILLLEYITVALSFILLKLGFRRKALLVITYVLGHFIAYPIASETSLNYSKLLFVLPLIYWVLLVCGAFYCKKFRFFDDQEVQPPTLPPPA